VRQHAGWIGFVVVALAVTFPTCWIVPGAKPRYFMPLFPCVAVLVGVVIEMALRQANTCHLARLWIAYRRLLVACGVGVAIVALVLASGLRMPQEWMHVSPGCAMVVVLLSGVSVMVLASGQPSMSANGIRRALLASAVIPGVAYTGLVTDLSANRLTDVEANIATLKQQLPTDARLVSFGPLETAFTYYYGEPVPQLDHTRNLWHIPEDVDYFCINVERGAVPDLPFAWRDEAVIVCDRWQRDEPQRVVIIGKRLGDFVAGPTKPPAPYLTAGLELHEVRRE
jgi:hypothetical protein